MSFSIECIVSVDKKYYSGLLQNVGLA